MLGFGRKRPIRFMDFVEEGISAGDIATKGVVSLRESDGFHLALKLALSGYRLIPILDDRGESVRGITTSKEILDFLGAGPLSREGGKEPLLAIMEGLDMGSDHDVFFEGTWRIPGLYLHDWPDRYIHTNFDVAAKIDPTKLKLLERAGSVHWTVTLEPDEEATLTYQYERYVPSH